MKPTPFALLKVEGGSARRMPARVSHALRLVCTAGVLALLFTGCASTDMKAEVSEAARASRTGPSAAPERTLTNFSDAMRCMDKLFITYGIRDVSVLVEDLDDKTKKVTAGTKDMLISATSSMTRRSRAIRLVTFGQDSRGLAEWVIRGQQAAPFNDLPLFAIRGSVSQFDQNIAAKEGDAGVAISDRVSVGVAKRASVSRMAIDLNMIYGSNFSIVPGVTSQNSIVLYNEGRGIDGDATIRKFGINFNMTMSRTEGQAQGLRNLVDLAAIELFGRLSRTPYWSCLGSNADSIEVAKEIEDWYYAMEANGDLLQYVQYQLRTRGVYNGPLDGQISPALSEAVSRYRQAMGGQPDRGQIDADFFKRYLSADHAQVMSALPPLAKAPAALPSAAAPVGATAAVPAAVAVATQPVVLAPRAAPPAVAERLRVAIDSVTGEQLFNRGQPVQLAVSLNRPAHLHCFARDENQRYQRIFPNRFNRDTWVRPGEALQLPGAMRFQLVASPRGLAEAVICYGTERDVIAQLPRRVTGADFETLAVASFDEIKNAFRDATNDQYAEGVFHVRTR